MTERPITSSPDARSAPGTARRMLNKVPEVTLYFWIIKVLATTVGETFADYLNTTLGFGLTGTTWIMSAALAVALGTQFRLTRYVPGVYWADNLTDNMGVSLVVTTGVFGAALAATFAGWFAVEQTLSIHTIFTHRREAFYWLAILFTFALGTAAGDLMAERLALGFALSAMIFAGAIAAVAVAHLRLGLNAVAAFWIAYVLTRPLGASIGDLLSQSRIDGGLGIGTTMTSAVFLIAILATVVFLSVTGIDRIERSAGSM